MIMGELVVWVGVPLAGMFVMVALLRSRVIGKKRLPALPTSGSLAVQDLGKYYELREPPIAWERISALTTKSAGSAEAVGHVILTPTVLEFCSVSGGKLRLAFDLFVDAIDKMTFDRRAFLPGQVGPGQGLLVIFSSSGETRLVATAGFAEKLKRAIMRSRSNAKRISGEVRAASAHSA